MSETNQLQRVVILLGKATHYSPLGGRGAICGTPAPEFKTHKIEKVDCRSCMRTKAWRAI